MAYYSLIFLVLFVLLAVLALWLPLRLPWLDPPLPSLAPRLLWLALHLPLPVVLCSEMARSVYGKDQKAHQKVLLVHDDDDYEGLILLHREVVPVPRWSPSSGHAARLRIWGRS